MLGCSPSVLPNKAKDGTSRQQTPSPVKPMQKKYNFSEFSTLPGYSIGNTDIIIIFLIHFPYLLSVFTRLDGGMNTRHNSVAKKMLNISAEQKPRNSPSKTYILLIKGKRLHVVQLRLPKWKSLLPPQNLNPRVCHKSKEIFSRSSKMTQP